jgi:hypothetical protein
VTTSRRRATPGRACSRRYRRRRRSSRGREGRARTRSGRGHSRGAEAWASGRSGCRSGCTPVERRLGAEDAVDVGARRPELDDHRLSRRGEREGQELVPVAEGGTHGPKVPSCRSCNGKRGKEAQARIAKRRAAGALDGRTSQPPPPPKRLVPLPWAKLGERRPRRKVYPSAIAVD